MIDRKLKIFLEKVCQLKSIDSLINSHHKFIREINLHCGLRDEEYKRRLFKTFNIKSNFSNLLTKFYIEVEQECGSIVRNQIFIQNLEIEINKLTERFIKKERKLSNTLSNLYKIFN